MRSLALALALALPQAQIAMMASQIVHGGSRDATKVGWRHSLCPTRSERWRRRLQWAVPAAVSIAVAGMLLGVAFAASQASLPRTHRAFASFTWFSCLTILTWTVLHDCATEGLSSQQLLRLRRCLPLIPSAATMVELVMLR